MVTNTWPAKRKRPAWNSRNRTTALPALPTPRIWPKSQIPCLRKSTAGRLAAVMRPLDLYRLSVFRPRLGRSKSGACFSTSIPPYQMEYSRNLLFRSGQRMDEIFQALIDRHAWTTGSGPRKTIFGDKNRPHYDKRKTQSHPMGSRGRDTCV